MSPGHRGGPAGNRADSKTFRGVETSMPDPTDSRVDLDVIHAAHTAGYALGYAHGRMDERADAQHAALHDRACRTIGLRPHNGPPLWSVVS